MKISGTSSISSKNLQKPKKAGAGGSGFAASISGAEESESVAQTGATSPIASIDALLSLQEVGSATDQRSKGLKHGHDMLDILEGIRRAILLGVISAQQLRNLADMARNHRQRGGDPALDAVLEEIELRAEVELAKYGY